MSLHKFLCKNCLKEIGVSSKAIGQRASCVLCGTAQIVPTREADTAYRAGLNRALAAQAEVRRRQAESERIRKEEEKRRRAEESAKQREEEERHREEERIRRVEEQKAYEERMRQRAEAEREAVRAVKEQPRDPANAPTAVETQDAREGTPAEIAEAINQLLGWHHSIVTELASTRVARTLGIWTPVPCKPGGGTTARWFGAVMHRGQENARGIAGYKLAMWCCDRLKVHYPVRFEMGAQTEACCDSLRAFFAVETL